MMELLKALGGGGGGGNPADAEAGMLDLLQKLSAGADLPGLEGLMDPPPTTSTSSGKAPASSGNAAANNNGSGSSSSSSKAAGKSVAAAPTASGVGSGGNGGSGAVNNGNSSNGGGGDGGGGADDFAMEGLLDNLVGQLLSKDVMHEPMKHLNAEFPRYLATHGESLSEEERTRYTEQQRLVAQILEAYEQAPDDTDRVATLMQKMQACGPPPPEIAGPVADGVGCCIS